MKVINYVKQQFTHVLQQFYTVLNILGMKYSKDKKLFSWEFVFFISAYDIADSIYCIIRYPPFSSLITGLLSTFWAFVHFVESSETSHSDISAH